MISLGRSVHILPVRPWLTDGELAFLLPLPEVLHLGVYQVAQALEIEAALRARAHEQVTPNTRSGNRVVDAELHGSLQTHHFLHEMVGARVDSIRPGDANGEPPS